MNLLFREALLSFRRAPLLSALSITAIAFSLFTVGLFGLVALNLRAGAAGRGGAGGGRGVPAPRHRRPRRSRSPSQDIASFPEVADVKFVDEDQALERARRELVEFKDAYRDLQVNPLPASLEIRLKEGFRDAAHVARGGRPDARASRSWRTCATAGTGSSGWTSCATWRASWGSSSGWRSRLVAVVIIGVTIRITVLQRAREIAIMRAGRRHQRVHPRARSCWRARSRACWAACMALALAFAAYELFRGSAAPLSTPGLLPSARHGAAGGVRRAARAAGAASSASGGT